MTFPQTATAAPKVTVKADTTTPASPYISSKAKQLGTAVDISVNGSTTGAQVTFPVTPEDFKPINGYTPSPANIFIVVYEPKLTVWVPLKTTYDKSSSRVSASAPHFSSFAKWVYDGADFLVTFSENVVKAQIDGIQLLINSYVEGAAKIWKALVSDEQQHVDCPADKIDPAHRIVFQSAGLFKSCVQQVGDGSDRFQLENSTGVPFIVTGPHSGWKADLVPSRWTSVTDVLAAARRPFNESYLPPRSVAEATVSKELISSGFKGTIGVDPFPFIASVVLGALSVVQGEGAIEEDVFQLGGKLPVLEDTGNTSQVDLPQEIRTELKLKNKAQVVEVSEPFIVAISCAIENSSKLADGHGESFDNHLSRLFQAGLKCAGMFYAAASASAYTVIARQIDASFTLAASMVGALKHTVTSLYDGAFKIGFQSLSTYTFVEGIDSSAAIRRDSFVTASGTQCLNQDAYAHTTGGVVDTFQTLTCYEPFYTGERPVNEQCMDAPIFSVTLNPNEDYPRPSGCVGDSYPFMTNSPRSVVNPYHARVGDVVNLGPAYCLVLDDGVVCQEVPNDGQMQFKLSKSALSIPVRTDLAPAFIANGHDGATPVDPRTAKALQLSYRGLNLKDILIAGGTPEAISGSATLSENTCIPHCADGNYKLTPIRFTLDTPQLTICYPDPALAAARATPFEGFSEHFFYTKISYVTAGEVQHVAPFGAPDKTSFGGNGCYSMPADFR